jgi:hypothetical protein
MVFSQAMTLFDFTLFAVYAADFIAVSRHNDAVVAKTPPVLMLVLLLAEATSVSTHRVEFIVMGLVVIGAASFGYANFLAFVKRGVTFSILSNHTRPPQSRIPDQAFIAIDDRLIEMRDHGWAEEQGGRWQLTASGHRVAQLRSWLMRVLRIEAVG